jgi:hypothetical protein
MISVRQSSPPLSLLFIYSSLSFPASLPIPLYIVGTDLVKLNLHRCTITGAASSNVTNYKDTSNLLDMALN